MQNLPSVAVAVKVAVPWLQNLQNEQAKRQRSSCLAPGLPEELHSVTVKGAESSSSPSPEAGGGSQHPLHMLRVSGRGWERSVGSEQNVTLLSSHRIKKKKVQAA